MRDTCYPCRVCGLAGGFWFRQQLRYGGRSIRSGTKSLLNVSNPKTKVVVVFTPKIN